MKLLLAVALISASFATQARDIDAKVIVGFSSYHFNSSDRKYLNQSNPSIGLELYDVQAVYVSKNSWDEESLYLTYTPDYKVNDYLSLSANIGIATGYKCTNHVKQGDFTYTTGSYCSTSGVVFLPALTVDYSPLANRFALSVSVNPSVAMLSVNYSFD